MKAICVDDERLLMDGAVSMCLTLPEIDEAKGFTRARDALDYVMEHPVDIALLDIDMPGMNGLQLAAAIKKAHPEAAIIFLTGFSEFAVDAFKVHASGYLLKPVIKEQLAENVSYALAKHPPKPEHIAVQTFGNFDVFVDGKAITFRTAKCKELLAYLVDKHGSSVTRQEAFAILWEDRLYDRGMQKQLDALIRNLRNTLQEAGIGDIFELRNGMMRVYPERFSCDAYDFFRGDSQAINAYRGEYMSSYSWASLTEGLMSWKQQGKYPQE